MPSVHTQENWILITREFVKRVRLVYGLITFVCCFLFNFTKLLEIFSQIPSPRLAIMSSTIYRAVSDELPSAITQTLGK
jgi:hypothetical protein